jgi:hypothetical protein
MIERRSLFLATFVRLYFRFSTTVSYLSRQRLLKHKRHVFGMTLHMSVRGDGGNAGVPIAARQRSIERIAPLQQSSADRCFRQP